MFRSRRFSVIFMEGGIAIANPFQSVYAVGKVHSGMIAYLCDLHREGKTEPLDSLLAGLGTSTPAHPVARRELKGVDLAILDKDTEPAVLIVEMKVDDGETYSSESRCQTVRYAEMFPDCEARFYVTLGMGEYRGGPVNPGFKWVKIRKFLEALQKIRSDDPFILGWREAIKNEIHLQDCVSRGDRRRMQHYRAGAWNIYLLGTLKEDFLTALPPHLLDVEASCYTWGRKPDTILHFCRPPSHQYHQYLEINNNGRLNLKVNYESTSSGMGRRRVFNACVKRAKEIHCGYEHELKSMRAGRRTQTVTAIDIGLVRNPDDGQLEFSKDRKTTVNRLVKVVRKFYRPA